MERGYHIAHTTEVMTMSLESYEPKEPFAEVSLTPHITSDWLNALFEMNGTTNPIHKKIVPSMYHAIPGDTIFATVYDGDNVIGTGLGILDRDYVGIYAIHVDPDYRRRKIGQSICRALLKSAREQGACYAYLQVVKGNFGARTLYESLGFEYLYTYWFRQQF
jgi:GNAT superfamily N-acetyltransferase